jgi:hypothetical protein
MGEKIFVGPLNRGFRNDRTAFVIDNDSFPTLINAYQWRGRVKRKRGTKTLGRLKRFFPSSVLGSFGSGGAGSGSIFIFTQLGIDLISPNAQLVPGSLTSPIVITFAAPISQTLTDDSGTGVLTVAPAGVITSATLNYNTGEILIIFNAAAGASVTTISGFNYYPDLPVMGLEDLVLGVNQFPGTIGFDTVYSYNISPMSPYDIYDVSFYKNPPNGTYLGYTAKGTWTQTTWNGQDYQQFWTTNYQGALWATNGIDVPFTGSTIGMQFKPIVTVTVTSGGPPAIVTLQITGHGLVDGDFVFINEVVTTTGINFQTGYVINVIDANNVSVEFPNATIATNGTGGIAQYLTNRSDPTKDCLRWYDGDPTGGTPPNPSSDKGWVNFAPPLSQGVFSIDDETAAIYYLVGARMIVPFKDRLLFLGPVIQTSSGNPIYLQDTVIYSQNGTPYYTASYTNRPTATIDNPTSPLNVFNPILIPQGFTASPASYFEDVTGFGGFVSAGIDVPMITVSPNEDVLIIGFDRLQTRLIYSGNDIVPFNFFQINSELGSSSTFSVINMDEGVITRGNRGFVITSQTECKRIDLEIPDQVFQLDLSNNGTERFTAQRDFINEWIYFTYVINTDDETYRFPNQSLQYNYRDNSWAIFDESYTTYGQFRQSTGDTWNTIGYSSWDNWNDPWNAGQTTLFQPQVIGGNQQGYVIFRGIGTTEGNSLYIQSISGSTITSPDHCLDEGDYIMISGAQGTIGTEVNGKIFSVVTPTQNTFLLNPSIGAGTYLGGGEIVRMYVPKVQTKQFPIAWDMAKKTRLGPQQYLLTTTAQSQITLLIFLSQNNEFPYNEEDNSGLIYSTILYTCPESTNLGLTPANTNLQMLAEPQTGTSQQSQIWHRINTSLLGDTVQIGFTLSDTQMRTLTEETGLPINQFSEIELHAFVLDVSPSQVLA